MKAAISIDPEEIRRFTSLAEEWWDEKGKFAPLHRINPLRIRYIRDHACRHFGRRAEDISPLSGLTLSDIGCGGGLICEPMARLGAAVTGLDAGEENIGVARMHARQTGLNIDYMLSSAEELAAAGKQFDIVLALEVAEHVADVPVFLQALCTLLKPGGLLVMSTLNRTLKSYLFAIVGAEYVLRWLPQGTHQWNKFLRPSELAEPLTKHGLKLLEMQGMVLDPLRQEWKLTPRDLQVNYLLAAGKPA